MGGWGGEGMIEEVKPQWKTESGHTTGVIGLRWTRADAPAVSSDFFIMPQIACPTKLHRSSA
jgi:hypothetical protein